MSEKTNLVKRAAQAAAFTVGGGVAMTFAMAGSASADTITHQESNVTNAGAAAANSGGNVAIGNASTNVAGCAQGAMGGIASNTCNGGNASNGTASITTGEATAAGSVASTDVDQESAGSEDGGLAIASQDTDVTNAGVAAANSGGNVAVGNASTNIAVNAQGAGGGLASNSGSASNTSNGTAGITTGAAEAAGNVSKTTVDQAAASGEGNGLAIAVQHTDVLNLGFAAANTGGNLALGNASFNLAANLQGAVGLIATNTGSATNASNGSGSVKTGGAKAAGNSSTTDVGQGIDIDPDGLRPGVPGHPPDQHRCGRRQQRPQRCHRQPVVQRRHPGAGDLRPPVHQLRPRRQPVRRLRHRPHGCGQRCREPGDDHRQAGRLIQGDLGPSPTTQPRLRPGLRRVPGEKLTAAPLSAR